VRLVRRRTRWLRRAREINGNGEEITTDTEGTIAWAYTCARKQQIEDEHTAETIAQGALECATFFFLGLGASAGASAFFSAAGAGAAASGAGEACAQESEEFAGGQQAATGAPRSLTRAPQD
jgi:hypothetical protein